MILSRAQLNFVRILLRKIAAGGVGELAIAGHGAPGLALEGQVWMTGSKARITLRHPQELKP